MPELFEATEERLVLKAYSSATISPATEPDPATDPAATGGQILRHVSHNLSLTKEEYASDEVRTDKQRPMAKHGTRRVPGTINGLLSPLTYADLLEASLGGTWTAAAIALDQTDLTSVAADNATATFTFGGGDPVSDGLRVGDPIQFTNLSEATNNATTFTILGFSGTSNRVVEVYPAPTDMAADSAFNVTTLGRSLIMPASGHVKRKFALEVYNSDGDIARLFTEGRFAGFAMTAAPNQNVQINFNGLWRNRVVYDGANAPFFTGPAAETDTDIVSSMDGLLRMNGATVGIVTNLSINFNRAPTAPAQLHREGLTPGVLLANAIGTGDFTLFLQDRTFLDAFDAATEFELLAYLPSAAHAVTIFLPRIKINSNNEQVIDGAKALQCGFTFARYLGTAAGYESTSIRIADTAVS